MIRNPTLHICWAVQNRHSLKKSLHSLQRGIYFLLAEIGVPSPSSSPSSFLSNSSIRLTLRFEDSGFRVQEPEGPRVPKPYRLDRKLLVHSPNPAI